MTQHHESSHEALLLPTESRNSMRQRLLQQRCAIAPEIRLQWDRLLVKKLLHWCDQHRPASIGVYWPIKAEPDLGAAYAELRTMGIALGLPHVADKNLPLQFLHWQPGDAMRTDKYGIPVPVQQTQTFDPDVLLIPCIGFSRGLFRLGYGGGFYDRTLAQSPRPAAVGIAYQIGLANFLAEPHDIAMDTILTEQ